MMDDAELLRAYADKKSEPAFAEFVGRRIGFVHAAALRQLGGDAQTTEDVTQMVFTLAARKAALLVTHKCLAGWLYSTTTHFARKQYRSAWRRAKREQEAFAMNELNQNAEKRVDVSEAVANSAAMRALLDEALSTLRENERAAVLLRFFEGRAFVEIGRTLEMSEDATRKRVTRAVEKMRRVLAKRGVTSTAAALGVLMSAEAAHAAPVGLAMTVASGAVSSASAIAGAATIVGAGGVLAFMSSTKITAVAVVALLVAAGGVFYSWHRDRAAADTLAAAKSENKALLAQLHKKELQAAAATAAAQNADDPVAAGKRLFAEHPEIKERFDAYQKAIGLVLTNLPSRVLGLSQENRDKIAIFVGASNSITYRNLPDYGTVQFGERPKTFLADEMLISILGKEDAEKFGNLWGVAGSFSMNELARLLYFTDTPLTAEQALNLGTVGTELARKQNKNSDHETTWAMLIDEARGFLSEPQIKALVGLSDEFIWQRERQVEQQPKVSTAAQ